MCAGVARNRGKAASGEVSVQIDGIREDIGGKDAVDLAALISNAKEGAAIDETFSGGEGFEQLCIVLARCDATDAQRINEAELLMRRGLIHEWLRVLRYRGWQKAIQMLRHPVLAWRYSKGKFPVNTREFDNGFVMTLVMTDDDKTWDSKFKLVGSVASQRDRCIHSPALIGEFPVFVEQFGEYRLFVYLRALVPVMP